MKKIELIAWKAAFNVIKSLAKFCIWFVRKKGDNFDMWKLGEVLHRIYLSCDAPIRILRIFEWFYDTGWDLMEEAARNELENIKLVYGWNEETFDTYPYEFIEDYFKN